MPPADSEPVAVARTRRPRTAQEYALVLAAVGIECELDQIADEYVVAVEAGGAERAAREIALYEEENRGWRPPEEMPLALSESWGAVLAWVMLLLATQTLSVSRAFGRDWWSQGDVDAGLVQQGELWRTITALGLHVDALHLLGNVLFGCLFVA